MNIEMIEEQKDIFEELDNVQDKWRMGDEFKEIHIDRMLFKIGELEQEIEELESAKEDSVEFYNRRIDTVKAQIKARSMRMETYSMAQAEVTGKKTIKVPNGTLRYVTRNKPIWPEDNESLLKFSWDNDIPTRVTEKPDKKSILEHIKESGDCPEGFKEEEVNSFTFKTN